MTISVEHLFLGLLALHQVSFWLLAYYTHRARVDAIRSIDRLLLLGKSATPGEAIAAYERLSKLERIRGATDELVAQRKRGDDVARKEPRGPNWFGLRRRPLTPPPATGG